MPINQITKLHNIHPLQQGTIYIWHTKSAEKFSV